MPKRVIDFDAMWGSDKIASCADWAQAEYAWLYGLADASGCFEITNLRVIWGRVAAIRSNLTIERLEQVFAEFQDKGLLFVWEHEGKRYAHWTGSDVPGRLPPPSWRMRLERFAPPVPKQKLAEYMARFARGRAALAGAGFRGEERGAEGTEENLKFQISDLRQNHRLEEDLKFEISELRKRTRGLKGQVEESQAQDLGLGLDLNLDRNREEDLSGQSAGARSENGRQGVQAHLWDSEANAPSSSEKREPVPDSSSRAVARTPSQVGVNPQAGERCNAGSPPRVLGEFDPRGMSAKEIALQKELRVGQGPVCWPKGVSQEVLERDRLRQLAWAKSR